MPMQKQNSRLLKERAMLAEELEGVKAACKQLKDQLAAGQALHLCVFGTLRCSPGCFCTS